MNNLQKDTILTLLKTDKMNGNYTNNYWFSYKDYLNPIDDFTDFCCECFEGKLEYIALIENLINKDKTAKVFVFAIINACLKRQTLIQNKPSIPEGYFSASLEKALF